MAGTGPQQMKEGPGGDASAGAAGVKGLLCVKDIELVLDFSVKLGKQMLLSGANLERVNTTIYRICHCYGLREISLFSLSSVIILSAKDADGEAFTRQIRVPAFGIQLERLKRLTQLSNQILAAPPEPEDLAVLLRWGRAVEEYPLPIILLGYVIAVTCLCLIFGGTAGDTVSSAITMLALFWLLRLLNRAEMNKMIKNALCMFLIGALSAFMVKTGIGDHFNTILIATTLIVIPGIPMVNAVRNLLCGNEMNSILELIKVGLETVSLVVGLFVSVQLFGGML